VGVKSGAPHLKQVQLSAEVYLRECQDILIAFSGRYIDLDLKLEALEIIIARASPFSPISLYYQAALECDFRGLSRKMHIL
jgi:hypothetical protein